MKYTVNILRRDRGSTESYLSTFEYSSDNGADTVASVLTQLDSREQLTDISGSPARKIEWECSCLQKKCGACAMVINGRPRLACDAVLQALGETITIEPLRKFPVICDLVVDRSILYENLRTMRLWLRSDADIPESLRELNYASSECIQCGCCLEICPNFAVGGRFFGMSTVPLTMRLLTENDLSECRETAKLYAKHTFAGCGKSLACRNVCPKGIDTEELLVNANAAAVWKRRKR